MYDTIQMQEENIAASSHYRGQAQEAATYAKMARSGRPTAARSNYGHFERTFGKWLKKSHKHYLIR